MINIEVGRDLPIAFEHEGVWYIARFGRIKNPEVFHVRGDSDPNRIVITSGRDLADIETLLTVALRVVREQIAHV